MIPCREFGYEYSSADRLEHPHRYQFSAYRGVEFIKEYFRFRECVLGVLKEKLRDPDSDRGGVGDIKSILGRDNAVMDGRGNIDVKRTLYALLTLVESPDREGFDIKPTLDLLVHKYEVSKRVYLRYSLNRKRCSDVYDDMETYGLLSLVCLLFYKRSRNLKYLNCSLKINDMLSSRIDKLDDASAVHLSYKAFKEELSIISDILDDAGVVV